MYKYQIAKFKKLLVRWFLGFFFSQEYVLWFNLSEEIKSKFQWFYNKGFSDTYITNSYSPTFSKDPFNDAISNIEDKSMKLKIAWSQYIERILIEKWCYLSQKKIRSILYYFVPEFRTELARDLKQDLWDYDNKKYIVDEDTVMNYCSEYYACENFNWYSFWQNDYKRISASSPEDLKTNCQEFFQQNYMEWKNNEQIKQKIETTQLWIDKYRNNSTDDSPYDIMVDLGTLAKLLYHDAQEPISPVFYNIPVFSNSKKALKESKEESTKDSTVFPNNPTPKDLTIWWEIINWVSIWWDWDGTQIIWNNNWNIQTNQDSSSQDTQDSTPDISNDIKIEYDNLIEWLNALSIKDSKSNLYNNICEDPEDENNNKNTNNISNDTDNSDFSELSDDEYQEIIDYMLDSVDKYSTLPEDKEKEIEKSAWDTSKYILDDSSSQLEDSANKIKNCRKSCEWLRIDQKASCMLKCSCWEIKSPIFNPKDTPWLWPIYIIKFCSVPWVDTKFSVWWKRIHSIEEWLKEIFWVVDKLSREGRLGKRTQQYEFLDSSTKKIKFADSFAFTIDVELVDIANRIQTHSDQYKEKKLKDFNNKTLSNYKISNPLNNPVSKNSYAIVWYLWEDISDYTKWANADTNRDALSDLNQDSKPLFNEIDNSNSNRYNSLSEHIWNFMDQEWTLRKQTSKYVSDLNIYTKELKSKK